MGKASTKVDRSQRHDPLHVQLADIPEQSLSKKAPRQKFVDRNNRSDQSDQAYLDSKISKKILKIAKEQQEQIDNEDEDEKEETVGLGFPEEEEEIDEIDEYPEYEEIEVDEADADILSKFLPSAPREKRSLADIIMEKINEKNASEGLPVVEEEEQLAPAMNPKVVEVYTKVGELLSRYKSGKLPKAFKIIPSLNNWEEILYITAPESWTPHATYEATRMFVSNLKPKPVQRFLNLILLDRIREDVAENKKLSYHLYLALKKSLYKPSAFFKGILFPLCESGNCTLKEASIFGSVLSKVSIPALHSSAALLRLAEMDYTGPNSLFIRVLLDKKYALPYKVVDSLVMHFHRFANDPREMPVLWHQSLLVFVQRYKQDLVADQKDLLLEVFRKKNHPGITPEARREIIHSETRDEMMVDREELDIMMMD